MGERLATSVMCEFVAEYRARFGSFRSGGRLGRIPPTEYETNHYATLGNGQKGVTRETTCAPNPGWFTMSNLEDGLMSGSLTGRVVASEL